MTNSAEEDSVPGAFRMSAARPRPDVLVVSIHGELDQLTAPEWTGCLREHDADRAAYLVLDLAGVTFLGSTGITLLLTELDTAQAAHQLFLTGVTGNRRVGRILELVGILQRFRTYPTVADLLDDLDAERR